MLLDIANRCNLFQIYIHCRIAIDRQAYPLVQASGMGFVLFQYVDRRFEQGNIANTFRFLLSELMSAFAYPQFARIIRIKIGRL